MTWLVRLVCDERIVLSSIELFSIRLLFSSRPSEGVDAGSGRDGPGPWPMTVRRGLSITRRMKGWSEWLFCTGRWFVATQMVARENKKFTTKGKMWWQRNGTSDRCLCGKVSAGWKLLAGWRGKIWEVGLRRDDGRSELIIIQKDSPGFWRIGVVARCVGSQAQTKRTSATAASIPTRPSVDWVLSAR